MIRASQRSMTHARSQGWLVASTELWVPAPKRPGGGIRRDAWGWCDMIVLRPDDTTPGMWEAVGVQACSMSVRAAHQQKLGEEKVAENIRCWLRVPGHRAQLWAWARRKVKRGGTALRWCLEVTELPA